MRALVLIGCLLALGAPAARAQQNAPVVVELYIELYRPSDGRVARFPVICRIDSATELEYFRHGGVLPYVLRNLAQGRAEAA